MSSHIREVASLSSEQLEAVHRLVRSAPGAADNPPLSEQAMLSLAGHNSASTDGIRHLLASDPDGPMGRAEGLLGRAESLLGYAQRAEGLLGYAQLDTTENPPTVELVAEDPETAAALLTAIDGNYNLWAHGAESVANQTALQAGLVPIRTLLQLRRTIVDLQLSELSLPDDVQIRRFVPGQDDQQWLAVNARAFADHPEQGSWTQRDLDERLSAPWFDAAGFLLAERAATTGEPATLLGYHWTKVHSDSQPPIGEVYVLGIDPAAQGLRLGTELLNEGLRYLQGRGLETALLYVEESNGTAIHLYGKAGFTVFASDLQYAGR